jgi:hypothetical protein
MNINSSFKMLRLPKPSRYAGCAEGVLVYGAANATLFVRVLFDPLM